MVSVIQWLLCFWLSLLSVGPLPGCSVDALQGIGRPVELYGAQTPPRFLTVFTESGVRTATWRSNERSPLWWLAEPERLVFFAQLRSSSAYVAGDLATGQLTRVRRPGPPLAVKARPVRSTGCWQVAHDGVRFRDKLVLADRGFELELWPSPSGRWIVVTEHQPDTSSARYLIGADGAELRLLELVINAPMPGPPTEWRSPDGRWLAERGPDGLVLRSASGELIKLPVGGSPVWSPDSSALATTTPRGIVVARLDRSIRQLVWGYNAHRIDAWTDQGIVYVVGKYGRTSQ